jgi:deoxycytidine triphosphate deaminase
LLTIAGKKHILKYFFCERAQVQVNSCDVTLEANIKVFRSRKRAEFALEGVEIRKERLLNRRPLA